jgi:Fe-S-cluster containining protein
MDLGAELAAARDLDVAALADSIESIGFECTRCGACCKGREEDHTATVFPDEVRAIQDDSYDWRDVARPMPFGLSEAESGDGGATGDGDSFTGETFEWALQTDACGDCTFYDDGANGESGACTVYGDRPLICRTYPFSVGAAAASDDQDGLGATEPMGGVVEQDGVVRAHECEGLGRDISREDAEELASTLKERTVRELEEAIDVRDGYEPTDADGVVVHDSEGAKRPDGSAVE